MNFKKTTLAVAVATAVGIPTTTTAASMTMNFSGLFTLVWSDGSRALWNPDLPKVDGWYQFRTPITGTAYFNLDTGAGTAVMTPFSFFGAGNTSTTGVHFQTIGDGVGGPGNLILGNMGFNWNNNNGIPVSIVWDATGLFGAIDAGITTSDSITGGVLAATEDFVTLPSFASLGTYSLPLSSIGPSPMATTSWNTTTIGGAACTLGCNPSGTLPLTDDGLGGSPMVAGPFPKFNANFDFTTFHVTSFTADAVPIPAAAWLFGTGLLGLISLARRKKN